MPPKNHIRFFEIQPYKIIGPPHAGFFGKRRWGFPQKKPSPRRNFSKERQKLIEDKPRRKKFSKIP